MEQNVANVTTKCSDTNDDDWTDEQFFNFIQENNIVFTTVEEMEKLTKRKPLGSSYGNKATKCCPIL